MYRFVERLYSMVSANYGASGSNARYYANNVQTSRGRPQLKSQYENPNSMGLSQNDYNALVDCYVSTPSESLLAAAWGGVTFGLINNPRFITHPINSFKALKGVDAMFKPVLEENHQLNKLWRDPKTNGIMRDAYSEMHRAFARSESRLAIFRKRYDKNTIDILKKEMQRALNTGNAEEIVKATERLKAVYVTDTKFGKLFRWLDKFSGGSPFKTQAEALKNLNSQHIVNKTAEKMSKIGKLSFKDAMKSHAGIGGIAMFAGFEFLMGMNNIIKSYKKDKENKQNGKNTNYGSKQLFQTTVKGLGSGIGWGVGEAVGIWAFAKYGAKLGSRLHPATGAIAGGVIGLVGGSIGMMLTGRLTKAAVGEDIGSKLEAREMLQTSEGQAQVLEQVYEKAQKGKANPAATAALKKIVAQMEAQQYQKQPET